MPRFSTASSSRRQQRCSTTSGLCSTASSDSCVCAETPRRPPARVTASISVARASRRKQSVSLIKCLPRRTSRRHWKSSLNHVMICLSCSLFLNVYPLVFVSILWGLWDWNIHFAEHQVFLAPGLSGTVFFKEVTYVYIRLCSKKQASCYLCEGLNTKNTLLFISFQFCMIFYIVTPTLLYLVCENCILRMVCLNEINFFCTLTLT